MLGQDRPEKNSAKCFIRSGEIPSPRQTSIDKTNDCVMNSERGAPVRGPTYALVSVHTTAGDTWRRRLHKNIWPLVYRKQTTKILDSSPMAKNRTFFRFGRRA